MALTINGIHRTNDKCHQRGEACISNQLVKEYPLKYENHSKFKSNFQNGNLSKNRHPLVGDNYSVVGHTHQVDNKG